MKSIDEIREKMDEVQIEKDAVSPLVSMHKMPFNIVVKAFEEICDEIDHEQDDLLTTVFKIRQESLIQTVDEYIKNIGDLEHKRHSLQMIKNQTEKDLHAIDQTLEKYKSEAAKALKYGHRYLGRTGSLRLSRSSPALIIYDETTVPDEFKISKTTVSVDKPALKQYLINGNTSDSASIKYNEHIMILKTKT